MDINVAELLPEAAMKTETESNTCMVYAVVPANALLFLFIKRCIDIVGAVTAGSVLPALQYIRDELAVWEDRR